MGSRRDALRVGALLAKEGTIMCLSLVALAVALGADTLHFIPVKVFRVPVALAAALAETVAAGGTVLLLQRGLQRLLRGAPLVHNVRVILWLGSAAVAASACC